MKLPALKPAEVICVLERNGFRRITKRKKHRIYTDGTRESGEEIAHGVSAASPGLILLGNRMKCCT